MLNAALWFGAVVFFTFGAAPALFGQEMLHLLPRAWAGAVALVLVKKYFLLHQICGVVALLHLLAERLYTGRPVHRLSLGLLAGLLAMALVSSYWFQPKLRQLHVTMYAANSSPEQKEQAKKSFYLWHGLSQAPNLLILGGLLFYLWQITHPANAPRFFSVNKFRE